MKNWVRAGKIKDAQGLRGELYVLLFAKEAPWINELQNFALGSDDEGPFEIRKAMKVRLHKDGIVLQADGLVDRTQAEAKRGLYFYLPADFYISKKGESIYLHEIRGFAVKTANETVGPIIDFSSNGPQDILVVDRLGKNVEIPFVDAFLKAIDFENRVVTMDLPEGLWDLE